MKVLNGYGITRQAATGKPAAIADTQVLLTLLEGEVVHGDLAEFSQSVD